MADTTVATVDSTTGWLRAVAPGTALVTAAVGTRADTMTVTVAAGIAAMRVATALDTLEAFDERAMRVVFLDSAGTVVTHGAAVEGRSTRWSSSDTTVATVDGLTGALVGVDRGTATVTARSGALTATARRVVVIRYRSIVAATEHACDLASGGIAWCWGRNARDGRLGLERLGDTVTSSVPVRVPGGHRFTGLVAYGRATCGLTADGRAYCWGANGDGQFGTGARGSSTTPVLAAGGMTFIAVAAGTGFTCGIAPAGDAWCWGYSGLGNLGEGGRPSFGNTMLPTPQRVVGGHRFRVVRASNQYACAIDLAGAAWCWGNNANGQLGAPSTSVSSVPVAVAGGHTFRDIATGYGHACGVADTDALLCWGMNKDGQLGAAVANGSTRPIRAAGTFAAAEASAANVATGGGAYTCAIAADRLTTACRGRNDRGQLGNGTATPLGPPNPTPTIVVGQKPLPRE